MRESGGRAKRALTGRRCTTSSSCCRASSRCCQRAGLVPSIEHIVIFSGAVYRRSVKADVFGMTACGCPQECPFLGRFCCKTLVETTRDP